MTTDDPDDTPTQFGMDGTTPGGEDRTQPSQPAHDPADRTLPSQPVEDRTVPSQPLEDRTLPTQPAQQKAQPAQQKAQPKSPTKGQATKGQAAKDQPPSRPAAAAGKPADGDDKTTPALRREAPRDVHGGLIGKTLGGCRIDKLLGKGAMGAVYKAVQLKLDRPVAVKVIRPEMMTDPRMLKRFEVEARTVGKFNSANVVMVHDVGFEQGVHFLVMEFVQGKNLREHVKLLVGGRLPVGEALPLIRQACAGLNEARRLGVVHRDIKPDNLMLTDQGVLKIADFGIAKPVEQDFSMTLTSELIGTPLYMSPEQCQGGANIDFRSDMYSLGATFFYLLTGEPPIRASSVYELIQTKTKLENLCLWKALPELAENNPLSRVIERMTANDRDDRYESYEELVNDLVLVQEGGTITLPAKKPKKPDQKRLESAKKGKGALLAVAALLAIGGGGGGYWWWQQQQPKQLPVANGGNGTQPNGGGSGVGQTGTLDLAAAQAALAGCRKRLAESGGSDVLRADLQGLALPAGLVAERDQLLADVDAAREIDGKLGALQRPEAPTPPFVDLQQYFAAVDAAAVLGDQAGGDVRRWLQKRVAAARAEGELGATARAQLVNTFRAWQRERDNATEAATIGVLGTRLEGIEQAHAALATLLPQQRSQLEQALSAQELSAARASLTTDKPVAPRDRDVSAALAECWTALAQDGPNEAVLNRARGLQPTREDQVREHEKLLNAIDDGRKYEDLARGRRRPTMPVAPFDDVAVFFRELDAALEKLKGADGELPAWAQRLRTDLRDETRMQGAVVTSCRTLFEDLRRRAGELAPITELERRRSELEAAQQAAMRLFPSAGEALAQAIPPAELDALLAKVRAETQKATFLTAVSAAVSRVDRVRTLADWQSIAGELDAELQRLGGIAAGLDATAAGALQSLQGVTGRWRVAAERIGAAGGLLAKGELTRCLDELGGAGGLEGGNELRALTSIAEQARDAFGELERTLDIAAAQKRLAAARKAFADTPGLPRSIDDKLLSWERGLAELKSRAVGMVAIPAGQTREPNARVAAFFLGATEVSCDEFTRFVRELTVAAGRGDSATQLAAVADRLAGTGINAARLAGLLGRAERTGNQPIERVTWYEAAAFAAWYGKVLPSKAEWALAAFGDNQEHSFPWGDDWSNDAAAVNFGSQLVDVGRGGLSWRSANGVELHHLAGNVGEWLASDPEQREAPVAGGRNADRRDAQRRFAGGEFDSQDKADDGIRGIGFRLALRPRECTAIAWPR